MTKNLLSVDDVSAMQVFQGEDDLCNVKFGSISLWKKVHFLGESMFFREKAEELPAWTVFKSEEKFFLVLERVVEFDDKGMVHTHQNVSFSHYVSLLFTLLNVFLL